MALTSHQSPPLTPQIHFISEREVIVESNPPSPNAGDDTSAELLMAMEDCNLRRWRRIDLRHRALAVAHRVDSALTQIVSFSGQRIFDFILRGLIQNAKEGGVDVIHVFWNGHELSPDNYYFGGRYDLVKFVKTVEQAGVYLILRIGPFVDAEWNYGQKIEKL